MSDRSRGGETGLGLSEIGESISDALIKRAGRVAARVQESEGLATDVLESDDAYLVVFDTPGATGSDVQVRFLDGAVQVRVDRFRDYYEGFEMRFPGRGLSLDGEARLPEDAQVDPDAATATLTDNGSLEVHLPKVDDDGESDVGADTEKEESGPVDVGADTEDDASNAHEHDESDGEGVHEKAEAEVEDDANDDDARTE